MYILVLFSYIFFLVHADNWAILVAGSNGYWNYRHQADICHAYHVLHDNGYPDNRIIVMMYDDIAYNDDNPFKGNIINKPNGPNLYTGMLKDYIGEQVNPINFLNILKGIKTENTTKVLLSNQNDDIFIYFADHGGPGIIAFPDDYLYAHQLIDTMKYMYNKKMYRRIVFYLEACESGSMFNGYLDDKMNIYAMTASTPFESSYACYYDNTRNAFLGDVYSVNWIENSDMFHVLSESIHDQFRIDKIETKTSTVCQYGNLTISNDHLYQYLAYNVTSQILNEKINKKYKNIYLNKVVNSHDIQLKYFMDMNKDTEFMIMYKKYQLEYDYVSNNYNLKNLNKTNICNDKSSIIDSTCIKKHIDIIEKNVGKLSDKGLSLLKFMSHLCYL